jgi:hypothetical protein
MANENAPFGLRSLYTLHGGPPQTELFTKVVGYGTRLFPGDVVNRVADGSIEKSITPGTTLITGVNLSDGAASTATRHIVIVDSQAVFAAQGDGSGSLDAADEGLNANLVLTAGDAVRNRSKHQIAESTKQTTNTLDVKLLKLLKVPDNEYGAYARFEILINKHRMHPAVAGV